MRGRRGRSERGRRGGRERGKKRGRRKNLFPGKKRKLMNMRELNKKKTGEKLRVTSI